MLSTPPGQDRHSRTAETPRTEGSNYSHMIKVSAHTIHLRQSIKCILGLPKIIYTQNRALFLVLKKKHIIIEEMSQKHFFLTTKNAGLLEHNVTKNIMALKTGNNRRSI